MRSRTRAPLHNVAVVTAARIPQLRRKGKPSAVFRSVLDWVRAGYPEEAPRAGHVSLVALTGPVALTPRQTAHILEQLRKGPTDTADIGVAICKITDRVPTDHQLRAVITTLGNARDGY